MEKLKEEIKKISSLALFFLIGFGYILLVMKLFLAEYDINTYVFSKAVISALVAAKAVAIMDMTPLLNRYSKSPRYIQVLYKTFLYTLTVSIITFIENLFHAYKEAKAIKPAIELFLETRNLNLFLAVTLCLSIVFLIHNIFQEIDNYLGKGKLSKLFFDRPKNSELT
ncbi:hypothetical protein [Geminocystis sp. NIES-3709]|uniref:hypothetical protein n=1 Tax=Geminocystis sp. NIES-3709 TaxID=1617448 RepID=UPI0005FC4AAD|nr:hypothetical protein [Geminocystis sp. NIES-3709]BAQ64135.1 hypothetical protein GM3709_900 [Geminocystis sp. NIES-3709]